MTSKICIAKQNGKRPMDQPKQKWGDRVKTDLTGIAQSTEIEESEEINGKEWLRQRRSNIDCKS